MWDPTTYLRFADERARPFADLVARVGAESPATVVDLGCGPGNLTVGLARRWPEAHIVGVDSSAEMISKARSLASTVQFTVGDVRDWVPDPSTDVVISNATLHWVPGHADLIAGWARRMRVGSHLAIQVPGNFDAPSHRELREVARRPRWRGRLAHLVREPDVVLDSSGYAALLRAEGCAVDAWETSYLHLLPSEPSRESSSELPIEAEHPVLRWMEGTALRPIRAALGTGAGWASFRGELRAALARAYPVREGVVYFPFRRVFCVATVVATIG